jgi:hypothetical protein
MHNVQGHIDQGDSILLPYSLDVSLSMDNCIVFSL